MSRLTESLNRDNPMGALDARSASRRLTVESDPVTMVPAEDQGILGPIITGGITMQAAAAGE